MDTKFRGCNVKEDNSALHYIIVAVPGMQEEGKWRERLKVKMLLRRARVKNFSCSELARIRNIIAWKDGACECHRPVV